MDSDQAIRRAALTRLAVATKELLPTRTEGRDARFKIYLDGLDRFHTNTVVAVCRKLETEAPGGWFPKLPELVEHMRTYLRVKQSQSRPSYQLNGAPVSPEKLARPKTEVALAVLGLDSGFETAQAAVIGEQDILGDRLVRPRRASKRAENFIAEATSLSAGDLVVHVEHGIRISVAARDEPLQPFRQFVP
jgi:hypothetical protein